MTSSARVLEIAGIPITVGLVARPDESSSSTAQSIYYREVDRMDRGITAAADLVKKYKKLANDYPDDNLIAKMYEHFKETAVQKAQTELDHFKREFGTN